MRLRCGGRILRGDQAIEVLAVLGMDFESTRGAEGYLVRGGTCLCTRLLSGVVECHHEPEVLANLIGSAVERTAAVETGNTGAYLVREGAAGVL